MKKRFSSKKKFNAVALSLIIIINLIILERMRMKRRRSGRKNEKTFLIKKKSKKKFLKENLTKCQNISLNSNSRHAMVLMPLTSHPIKHQLQQYVLSQYIFKLHFIRRRVVSSLRFDTDVEQLMCCIMFSTLYKYIHILYFPPFKNVSSSSSSSSSSSLTMSITGWTG